MSKWVIGIALSALLMLYVASSQPSAQAQQPKILVVATPNPFYKVFVEAFKKDNPGADVNVVFKGTTDVLKQVRAEKQNPSIDVWWGGGIDAFETARKEDLLQKLDIDAKESDDALKAIPKELAGLPLYNDAGFYFGYTVGGFGIMWNTKYTGDNKIPEPKEWADLTNSVYRKHVIMADPARSGSTLAIVEIILQSMGWNDGWKLLKEISANTATFSARSSEVPDAVVRGDHGVGLVIDFYAFQTQQKGAPIKFVYPTLTIFNADSMALIKGSPNQELGKKFINWLLSKKGQSLLFDKEVYRPPIRKDAYEKPPAGFPNPFGTTLTVKYNSDLGAGRNAAVPAIFTATIINRHVDLVSAEDEIIAAKKALDTAPSSVDLSKPKGLLNQAVKKFAAVPIDEAKASEINSRLSKDSTFLASQTSAWSESALSSYKDVSTDAKSAVAAIPPPPPTIAGVDVTLIAAAGAVVLAAATVAVWRLRAGRQVKPPAA